MPIRIEINTDTAADALDELRNLANALVEVAGPAPKQHELSYGPGVTEPPAPKPDPRNQAELRDPPDLLKFLLDGTIKAIKAEMPKMSTGELQDLSQYEQNGKDRATLLKAIEDEITSRNGADEPDRGEDADDSEAEPDAKANTGLDDEPETKAEPDPAASEKASGAEAAAAGTEGDEPDPSIEECREIGRQVQRLKSGTEMLRALLAELGTEKLSTAHKEGKGAAFIAGCEKILAEQSE